MATPTLLLPPDQNNYTFPVPHSVVATILDGGASRFRNDVLGSSFQVTVQWTLDKRNFNYLMAFYRSSISYGALPFILGLLLDAGDIQNYTVHFVPDTLTLASQSGATYVVTAIIEVMANVAYAAGDAALIGAGPD